jgi:hypothetical protein
VSEGSFQNGILFFIKYKVLFHFAIAASVAVEVLRQWQNIVYE